MVKTILFLLFIMEQTMALTLTSSSFGHNTNIPSPYTCDGRNVSPHLCWSGTPEGTHSFVLICDDPDAPMGTWIHWVLLNIPATVNQLEEAISTLPAGTIQGMTSFNTLGYGGPCPPSGTHRYFFKLYALDTTLSLSNGVSKAEVENAMKDHILDQAELIGLYQHISHKSS
jgi:hypothetical protein